MIPAPDQSAGTVAQVDVSQAVGQAPARQRQTPRSARPAAQGGRRADLGTRLTCTGVV